MGCSYCLLGNFGMDFSGDLAVLEPLTIFQIFNLTPLTGKMKFIQKNRTVSFFFKKGDLIYAKTDGGKKIGKILFEKQDILELSLEAMREIRWKKIAMIFQAAMNALNPVQRVDKQIAEALLAHEPNLDKQAALQKTAELFDMVGIPPNRLRDYPHQYSGGMKQRAIIAMALVCQPLLLIADEPTTALDVTIQAQILGLLKDLQKKMGTSILMITHDLGVIAETARDVAVMYASGIIEMAESKELFDDPLHPYTVGLLKSLPRLGYSAERLETIEGNVPDPLYFPLGCKFHPRCPLGSNDKRCQKEEPQLKEVRPGRKVACWKAEGY